MIQDDARLRRLVADELGEYRDDGRWIDYDTTDRADRILAALDDAGGVPA